MTEFVDIVFDGPPAPESGRFVEVEDDQGHGLHVGEWVQRPDGYWALRVKVLNIRGGYTIQIQEDMDEDVISMRVEDFSKILDLGAKGWEQYFRALTFSSMLDVDVEARMNVYVANGFKQWNIDKVEELLNG